MKLDIQLFSETTNMVNTDTLKNISDRLKSVANELLDNFNVCLQSITDIHKSGAYDTSTGVHWDQSSEAKAMVEEVRTNLIALAEHLLTVGQTYEQLDLEVSKGLEEWFNTFNSALTKLKNGIHSTAAKGSYSVGSYLTDMSASTRTIVGEVFTMAEKTGHFYKSTTGYSFAESAEKLVGSVKTLFNSSGEGGIFTRFVNQLVGTSA